MRTNPSSPSGIMLMLDTTWPSSSCHGSCQQFLVGSVVQLSQLPAPCEVAFYSLRFRGFGFKKSHNKKKVDGYYAFTYPFSYLYPSYPPQTTHLSSELPYILRVICLNSLRWTCMSNGEGAFQVSSDMVLRPYGVVDNQLSQLCRSLMTFCSKVI